MLDEPSLGIGTTILARALVNKIVIFYKLI